MSTIRRMPSGKYQAVLRINGYKPKYKTFQDKLDAIEWANALEHEIKQTSTTSLVTTGSTQDVLSKLKWAEAVDRYVTDINQHHKGYERGDKYRAKSLRKESSTTLLPI